MVVEAILKSDCQCMFVLHSGAQTVLLLAFRRFSSDHRNYRRGEKRLVTWFSLFYMSLFHPSYLLLFLLLLFLCLLLTQPILFPMIRMMPNLPRDGHGCSSFQEYSLVSCTTWLRTQTQFLQSCSHSSYKTHAPHRRGTVVMWVWHDSVLKDITVNYTM